MVPALRGMMGCDSVDYYIESPIDIMGVWFIEYLPLGHDIHIQVVLVDLNSNTSIVEEAVELIDSTSPGGKQSADSLQRR